MAVYVVKFPNDESLEDVHRALSIIENVLSDNDKVLAVPMNWDFSEYSVEELVHLKENMNKMIDEAIHAKNFVEALDVL